MEGEVGLLHELLVPRFANHSPRSGVAMMESDFPEALRLRQLSLDVLLKAYGERHVQVADRLNQ